MQNNIREEYIHFDDYSYCKGRASVMNTFLSKDSIYFTEGVRWLYEKVARENIAKEIDLLKNKSI